MDEKIAEYEANRLSTDEVFELFQELIDTGLAWRMDNRHYGRTATDLIKGGYCTPPAEKKYDSGSGI